MEGAIIARCRFDSKTVAIPVFNSFSYMDLCNQISSRFTELVSGHFELTYSIGNHPIDIVHDFKQNYGLDIFYYNAWKGKEMAQIQVHGDEALPYKQLVWYVDALKETNKVSHCVLECDESSSRFKRLFLSFNASIEGFKHCRPFLCLDGTHIKNKYKGHLLAATGKNGNQGIYPLAYAIVDSENEENWTWFLQILHKILEPQDRTITFISDRCKGLLPSVRNVFPNSPHAFCLYHLKNNITSKYPYTMGKGFRNWIVTCFQNWAYAPDINHFELHMSKLTKDGGETIDSFLEDAPKENWSNAFFPGKKYGKMCSNVAESFNSWIQAERELRVYQLVDRLRIKLMVSYSARLRASNKWTTTLCPKMEKRLNKSYEAGRHWDVSRSNDYLFEVHDAFAYSVDLQNHTCSCHEWQIKGFPCAHAVAAIVADEGDPYKYVEPYFTTDYYKKTYEVPIFPISDIEKKTPEELDNIMVKPPLTRKPPGRPRK